MGDIFVAEQTADGAIIAVPAGTTTGVIRLTRNNLTFRGAGRDVSIIKLDNTRTYGVDAGAIVGGGPCLGVTLEDLTIDADQIATTVAVIASNMTGGPQRLTLRRVRIRNHNRNTIAIGQGSYLDARCVEIIGNGLAVQVQSTSQGARIRDMTITGGTGGVIASGAPGTVNGIDIDTLTVTLDYWASVRWETVTPTAYSGQYVDVVSHVQANRALYDVVRVLTPVTTFAVGAALPANAKQFDRIEVAAGTWAQVEANTDGTLYVGTWRAVNSWNPVTAPTGTATVYRVQLGKLFGSTATRLLLSTAGAELGRWRYVGGSPCVCSPADPATDTITFDGPSLLGVKYPLAHGFVTGDGPVHVVADAGATLPGGLAVLTNYYVIRVDDYKLKLATSNANALAGVAIDITSAGTGEYGVIRIPSIVAGSKLHIIRAHADSAIRDVDSGAVHLTDAVRDSRVRRVTVRGGFSDGITVRGAGRSCLLDDCAADLCSDMGATVDGTSAAQIVHELRVTRSGQRGIYVTGGPSNLRHCHVESNGLVDDGDGAYGVSGDLNAIGTTVSVSGPGGRSGVIVPGAPVVEVALTGSLSVRRKLSCS